jgi:hypothetical protein
MAVGKCTASAIVTLGLLVGAGAGSASANMCDLTTLGSTCGPTGGNGWSVAPGQSGNLFAQGAIFQQVAPQPTGSGYIDSFVRIQHSPTEQGYNTDARPLQFDEKTDATFTHSITVANVPIVNIGGIPYRQFFLDINENNSANGHNLSLDKLQIFLGSSGNLTGYTTTSGGRLAGLAPIYNLDTGTDNWIKLDYSLNNGGSGIGDMVAYIPDSLFVGTAANPYVYLYSQFGATMSGPTKLTSDAGFEEWWTKSPIAVTQNPVPEPTGLLLLGSGLVFAGKRLRSRRRGPAADDGSAPATKVAPDADLSAAIS